MTMDVTIIANERGNPPGKLADAELHFGGDGPLSGLKLIGFGVWERRATKDHLGQAVEPDRHYNVTFPARQYSVNGERRSFALLRPIADMEANNQVKEAIIAAYIEQKEHGANG